VSAWLLERPRSINDRHPRYLVRFTAAEPETTALELLALRFSSAQAAREFATYFEPALDDWRIVKR
jgi:hypothetical protein